MCATQTKWVQSKGSQVLGWSQAWGMSVSQGRSSYLLCLPVCLFTYVCVCVCVCVRESGWLAVCSSAWSLSRPSLTLYPRRGRRTGFIKTLSKGVCVCVCVCAHASASGSEEISSLPWHVLSSCLFSSWQTPFWLPVIFFLLRPFPQGWLNPLYCVRQRLSYSLCNAVSIISSEKWIFKRNTSESCLS